MRARSVQLVTSWWVVGVWAALGISTGVISVVTVFQPTWYVRYTFIHAQEARGVAFQVVVSSVGPLGYCRLASLDTSHSRTRSNDTFSRPQSSPDGGVTTTQPIILSTETSSGLELPSPSQTTSDSLEEERSTPGVHYSTSESEAGGSGDDGGTPFGGPWIADKGVTDDDAPVTESIFFRETVTASMPVDEDKSNGATLFPEEKMATVAFGEIEEETQETSKHETAITEERNTTRNKQDGVDTGRGGVHNGEEFIDTNAVARGDERHHRKPFTGKSKERKNRKRKRKKKKGNRHRQKSRKEIINTHSSSPEVGSDESQSDVEASTDMQHLLESHEDSANSSGDEGQIIASYLKHPESHRVYHDDIDYYPRTPILLCSGLGVGSGSSAVWALVGVLYGAGGVVQVAAGVASLALNFIHSQTRRYTLAIWVGNVQVAVVMSQSVALVLFPLGLGSPLARLECGGSSSVYWPGECNFGWSYMLGVVTTSLAAYCPCLARLTVFRRYVLREWESLNFF